MHACTEFATEPPNLFFFALQICVFGSLLRLIFCFVTVVTSSFFSGFLYTNFVLIVLYPDSLYIHLVVTYVFQWQRFF